ncbi:MAG: dihydroxyacetone kinase subunit L [Halanaerobiales bacterium]|nr:dihydroxyacetone kinase subunit L [Halanaerobiales bacterium]
MSVVCDKNKVLVIIKAMAEKLISEKEYLTELDTKIGDGDHGISMERGFSAIQNKLPEIEDKDIGTILKTLGMTLVSSVGGASGPLLGTAFMYAGNQVIGKESLNLEDGAKIAKAALDGVLKRGKANLKDKTMVDTISPVVDFLNSSEVEGKDALEILKSVEEIAKQGMESTKSLMALKGRASFLKERSIGHLDPGAVSSYLIIQTIVKELLITFSEG